MNSTREIFISNLKHFRKLKNMTQLTLSVELEKSSNYIGSIENRALFPPPETIDQIAEILEIEPSQLFDKNGSPENILKNSWKEYVEEVSTELEKRISKTIQKEMRNLIKK